MARRMSTVKSTWRCSDAGNEKLGRRRRGSRPGEGEFESIGPAKIKERGTSNDAARRMRREEGRRGR
jgi:hypothetical protein